ncbi:MAG: hypothetical protein R3B13_13155 [Polyangiaceae bacterium]
MLHIDIETFLALTAALATASCGSSPKAESPRPSSFDTSQASVVVDPPEPPAPTASGDPVQVVEDPAAASLQCDNDVGDVDCSFIDSQRFAGPMCEGFQGSCESLGEGHTYRRRVGAAIARCYAKEDVRACNIRVRQQCIRSALDEACPESRHEAYCQEVVRKCQASGRRPDFGVDQCVRALSGIGEREREWAKGAMGGPAREGCKLMFPVY